VRRNAREILAIYEKLLAAKRGCAKERTYDALRAA